MRSVVSFFPFLLFLLTFLGSGLYFHLQGEPYAFYKIPPTVAVLPAIILSLFIGKGTLSKKINILIRGMRNHDVMSMCLIFIFAGAFGTVTKSIGSTDCLINISLTYLPEKAILPGIFLISAFMSFSVGTSMGVIAALAPISIGFSEQSIIPLSLGLGTVIGGAMFGDNLSLISDTTIAATQSQNTSIQEKFKFNAPFALMAAVLVLVYLFIKPIGMAADIEKDYDIVKLIPYFLVIVLAIRKLNVFLVLILGTISAGVIGMFFPDYTIPKFARDIADGFSSMNEIMVLSLLVGGLGGMLKAHGGINWIIHKLQRNMESRHSNKRQGYAIIATLVSISDICLANNTIAIILTGGIAKKIKESYDLKSNQVATWLSTFSCIFQGILPYSAQVLLACSLGNASPISVIGNVYYCYALGIISIAYISFKKES